MKEDHKLTAEPASTKEEIHPGEKRSALAQGHYEGLLMRIITHNRVRFTVTLQDDEQVLGRKRLRNYVLYEYKKTEYHSRGNQDEAQADQAECRLNKDSWDPGNRFDHCR
jgi:hypothetical protein